MSLFLVMSAVSGITGPAKVQAGTADVVKTANVSVAQLSQDSSYVQNYVSAYFSDIPVMANIAWCESRDRQFNSDGNVFEGTVNHDGSQDIGVMQINNYTHLNEAEEANYNLYSLEGNVAYARVLFEKSGTTPWNSSKKCWGNMATDGSDIPTIQSSSVTIATNQN